MLNRHFFLIKIITTLHPYQLLPSTTIMLQQKKRTKLIKATHNGESISGTCTNDSVALDCRDKMRVKQVLLCVCDILFNKYKILNIIIVTQTFDSVGREKCKIPSLEWIFMSTLG